MAYQVGMSKGGLQVGGALCSVGGALCSVGSVVLYI